MLHPGGFFPVLGAGNSALVSSSTSSSSAVGSSSSIYGVDCALHMGGTRNTAAPSNWIRLLLFRGPGPTAAAPSFPKGGASHPIQVSRFGDTAAGPSLHFRDTAKASTLHALHYATGSEQVNPERSHSHRRLLTPCRKNGVLYRRRIFVRIYTYLTKYI